MISAIKIASLAHHYESLRESCFALPANYFSCPMNATQDCSWTVDSACFRDMPSFTLYCTVLALTGHKMDRMGPTVQS